MTAPVSLPPDAEALAAAPRRGPQQDRSPLPDVLRGAALLGILVVNMQDFAGLREWQQAGLDRAAQVFTDMLFNGRFISIFAMLFGWGAAGLLARQGAGVFLRRHLALLVVGSLHFVLVWHGDIIATYAVLGLALMAVARLRARALLVLASVLGAWWLLEGMFAALAFAARGQVYPRFSGLPSFADGGTYAGTVAGRAAEYLNDLLGGAVYNGPWLVALFCLGAAAGKTGLLLRPQDHLPLLRRFAAVGVPLGLVLGGALAWLNTRGDYLSGLAAIPVRMSGGLAGALGYVGLIGLLAARGRLGPLRHLAASGRTAMSNYLAQSLVMTTVFYPYAGAQFGRWGAAATLALALGFGLLQLPLSAWTVRRFGTGPAEWLVRRVVYGGR